MTTSDCAHSWVAGFMYVPDEDLDSISALRDVTCEYCDEVYSSDQGPITDPVSEE